MIFGAIGCVGNLMCIIIFSQKFAQKSFHHLMLSLAIFDLLYVLMSIMLFGLPTLYPEYWSINIDTSHSKHVSECGRLLGMPT